MCSDAVFFYTIAGIFFVFAVIEGVRYIIMHKKLRAVTGTIIEIKRVLPDTMKAVNSKWAAFNYCIDGKTYISENRIAVPMSAQIGDTRRVKYRIDHPWRLYSLSPARFIGLLAAAILCALAGYLLHT